uniref:Uncharacterized protein n=1 Tax=Sphaerodactylus townsendi TaxID=933632 RepID=A0ACB8G2G9_9SAUR
MSDLKMRRSSQRVRSGIRNLHTLEEQRRIIGLEVTVGITGSCCQIPLWAWEDAEVLSQLPLSKKLITILSFVLCMLLTPGSQLPWPFIHSSKPWIMGKIKCKIKGYENFKSVGILDTFDGEFPGVESLWSKFNINYANEKPEEYFNKHIFSLEQL